jgi:hypothetical protein
LQQTYLSKAWIIGTTADVSTKRIIQVIFVKEETEFVNTCHADEIQAFFVKSDLFSLSLFTT